MSILSKNPKIRFHPIDYLRTFYQPKIPNTSWTRTIYNRDTGRKIGTISVDVNYMDDSGFQGAACTYLHQTNEYILFQNLTTASTLQEYEVRVLHILNMEPATLA